MKTVKTSIIAVAVALLSINATFAEDPATTTPSKKEKSFDVGMFQSQSSMKMNLTIENYEAKQLKIALKNGQGEEIYNEIINKKTDKYWRKFDLSELTDGLYRFEISDGNNKIVKEVNIATQAPTRNVVVNE
jgi:hypothetical protein